MAALEPAAGDGRERLVRLAFRRFQAAGGMILD
jgi:hypothetical protein